MDISQTGDIAPRITVTPEEAVTLLFFSQALEGIGRAQLLQSIPASMRSHTLRTLVTQHVLHVLQLEDGLELLTRTAQRCPRCSHADDCEE